MWKTEITEEELGFVCGSEKFTRLISDNFAVANVLIFETTGSILLSYAFVVYGGYSTSPQYPYIYVVLNSGFYFASLLWSARYCAPSLNPAITIANFLNSHKKLSTLMICLYLACEFFGTLCGSILGFTLTSNHAAPAMDYLQTAVYAGLEVSSFFQSLVSAFVYMVIVLVMTTPHLSFAEIELQIWFAMPLVYSITALFGNSPLGCNFFLTLVVSFLGGCYSDTWVIMKSAWGLVLGPFLGSLLGAAFFEYFYKPLADAYKEELAQDSAVERQEQEQRMRERVSVLEIA